jgi:hypothetical protein
MTDFRALCEELVETLEGRRFNYVGILDRARAALAEQPVGPTDEEINAWHQDCIQYCNAGDSSYHWVLDTLAVDVKAIARAVLATWGQS